MLGLSLLAPAAAQAGEGGACQRSDDGDASHDVIQGTRCDDEIDGAAGNDRITSADGDDDLDGGRGEDYLDAGDGRDELRGGAGEDVFNGGGGNDRIVSRDGVPEIVNCDRGRDVVIADRTDQLTGCEDRRVARKGATMLAGNPVTEFAIDQLAGFLTGKGLEEVWGRLGIGEALGIGTSDPSAAMKAQLEELRRAIEAVRAQVDELRKRLNQTNVANAVRQTIESTKKIDTYYDQFRAVVNGGTADQRIEAMTTFLNGDKPTEMAVELTALHAYLGGAPVENILQAAYTAEKPTGRFLTRGPTERVNILYEYYLDEQTKAVTVSAMYTFMALLRERTGYEAREKRLNAIDTCRDRINAGTAPKSIPACATALDGRVPTDAGDTKQKLAVLESGLEEEQRKVLGGHATLAKKHEAKLQTLNEQIFGKRDAAGKVVERGEVQKRAAWAQFVRPVMPLGMAMDLQSKLIYYWPGAAQTPLRYQEAQSPSVIPRVHEGDRAYSNWRLPSYQELLALTAGWSGASPARWLADQTELPYPFGQRGQEAIPFFQVAGNVRTTGPICKKRSTSTGSCTGGYYTYVDAYTVVIPHRAAPYSGYSMRGIYNGEWIPNVGTTKAWSDRGFSWPGTREGDPCGTCSTAWTAGLSTNPADLPPLSVIWVGNCSSFTRPDGSVANGCFWPA